MLESYHIIEDLRQSDNWARFMKSLGWEKVFLGDGVGIGYLRKFLGIFTIIKIQRPRKLLDEKEIDALARKNKAILVKIEPKQGEIGDIGCRSYRKKDNWPLLPPSEVHLNLDRSEEDILKSFSESARRNLKKISELRFQISEFKKELDPTTIERFWKMFSISGEEKGYFVENLNILKNKIGSFLGNGYLVLVEDTKGDLVAGICVLEHNGMAYYDLAGATAEGKKLNAPYFALWQAILGAKKRGCQIFNLEGVYDPRFHDFTKNWKGFTEFKSRFGGWRVEYPGSFSRWYLFGLKV